MTDVSRETFENYLKICPWPVSRETLNKFKIYEIELLKWQKVHNLISRNSIDILWERHFLDSAQLVPFVSCETKSIIDLGSGAGFPGIIISLITNIKTILIESNIKKITFLDHIRQNTNASIELIHNRIELLKNLKADIVTARALAPLKNLLKYAHPLFNSSSIGIFLKGESWQTELNVARETWIFDYELKSSITNDKAMIIIVKNLKKRSAG